jgi:hypothetical protein
VAHLSLTLSFTELEVEKTIKSEPKEKALRADGFIGSFFRSCQETIKVDIVAVVNQFYNLNRQGLYTT